MSTLIVLLPPAPRLNAQTPSDAGSGSTPAEWPFVLTQDGDHALQVGQALPEQLPQAQAVVALLRPAAISWHGLTAPKAPANRLRAALAGLLEEALLDEDSELHLAVAAGWKAGEPGWVAAIGKAWLKAQLDRLEALGRSVDRLAPLWSPEGAPVAHVFDAGAGQLQLLWRDADGLLCLPLAHGAARQWLQQRPADAPAPTWSARPDAATEAAGLAGDTVATHSLADGMLAAARQPGNLLQFDLAAQHRGSRRLRQGLRRLLEDRAWRPLRWGLVALLLVHLVGLNAWAWQQRQALARQKTAMTTLLQSSFPQVRAIIDPPAQMQKELELLRAAAGKPGEGDLEPLLHATDAAWPPSHGPAESIKFEPGRLTLGSPGWTAAELQAFRSRLWPLGLDAEGAPGRVVVARARPGSLPPGTGTGTGTGANADATAPVRPGSVPPRPAFHQGGDT
jgi:general secretion pathway protein L